jgi:hypothetical protein
MDEENSIQQDNTDNEFITEAEFNKFRNLAPEFFHKEYKEEIGYLTSLKAISKLSSFVLPPEYNDSLILYNEAPYYWLCESPLIVGAEEYFKRQFGKLFDSENVKAIKGFYTKWAIQKEIEPKSYFAKSTMVMIEKNPQKNNFLNMLYYGTILTFDQKFCNPIKSLELYGKAKGVIASLNLKDNLNNDFNYLILIYSGFAYIKNGDFEKAIETFSEALVCKSNGVTAKYYLAYVYMLLEDIDNAKNYLQEVLFADIFKVQYAISVNSANLVEFFCENAASMNLFFEKSYIPLAPFLQEIFRQAKKTTPEFIDALNDRALALADLHYEEYYDKEIKEIIPFVLKVYQTFKGNNSVYLLANADKLLTKFNRIYDIILAAITKRLTARIKETLIPYDNQMAENAAKISALETESDAAKKTAKEEYEKEIKIVEDKSAKEINNVENLLNGIKKENKFNPQNTFTNSMFYNIIISFVIFVISGLASYSNTSGSGGGSDFSSFFSAMMIGGAKWALITFFLGIIISFVASGIVAMEKANYKQKMLNKIDFLKTKKEKDLAILKKTNESKLADIEENFKSKIDSAKESNKSIDNERYNEEQKVRGEVDDSIKIEVDKLNRILA